MSSFAALAAGLIVAEAHRAAEAAEELVGADHMESLLASSLIRLALMGRRR